MKSGEPVSGAPKVGPKILSKIELNTLENYDLGSKRCPKKGSPPKRPPKKAPENDKNELNTLENYDLELPEMEPNECPKS